jgi:hypothetical protein
VIVDVFADTPLRGNQLAVFEDRSAPSDDQRRPDAAPGPATHRILDHYLHTAHTADLLLTPSRPPITPSPARPGVTPEHLAGYHQALGWFEAEYHVLLAAIALAAESGFSIHAWQIAWTMWDFLDRRGHWHEQLTIQRTALAATIRLGDPAGQAVARRLLAMACARLAKYDEARAHLSVCLGSMSIMGQALRSAGLFRERRKEIHGAR